MTRNASGIGFALSGKKGLHQSGVFLTLWEFVACAGQEGERTVDADPFALQGLAGPCSPDLLTGLKAGGSSLDSP